MKHPGDQHTGFSIGFAGLAVIVAASFVPLRDRLGGANMALILVMVVVAAAAAGGRIAGAVTAIAASLSFNFFYTKPYLTVRIDAVRDIVTVALILGVGLAVGELGLARSRQSMTRRSHLSSMRSLEVVGALVNDGESMEDVWQAVRDALVRTLHALEVRYEPLAEALPAVEIERDGRVEVRDRHYLGDGFVLPGPAVAIPVVTDGMRLGQIVVTPDPEFGVTREQRRTAVALADQYAIALRIRRDRPTPG